MKRARVVAEIGCNHKGEIEIAKEMVRKAKEVCNVDVVKFQKRNIKELLTEEQYNNVLYDPSNYYGDTYGAHREYLEFTIEQHIELKRYCEELGVIYSSSVWDLTSAKQIASLNPEFIKIPSACNNHYQMLDWLCDNYEGEIHVSTGMTTKDEIEKLISLFIEKGRNNDMVLYSCTSGYPISFQDVALLEISNLLSEYGTKIKEVGFSGHHLGIAVDVAAYTLGATTIERHFTLNRAWKGTDHSASLEPEDVRKLVQNLESVNLALGYKEKDILDIEIPQRKKLKYKAK